MRALIVGAPRSGSGKTTVTLALLAALRRRGLRVQAAKSGPDYIDGAFHAAATGMPCPNLDSWAMPPDVLAATLAQAADGADLLVIESAMGLFDGVGAPGQSGAAADLARRFGLPVLLVLDVSGQSQTAGAVARGFAVHDPGVHVVAALLNRVGSERHRAGAADAVGAVMPVVGALGRDSLLTMPERHLGLVQAQERGDLPALLDRLADAAERQIDLDAVLALAAPVSAAAPCPALPPPGQRIALAQDRAFSFMYPHLLAAWRAAGAEIVPFSPLADEAPPGGCDVCWLPGGYPELYAGALAAGPFLPGLRRFAGAVHGECGGYMVLGAGLVDAGGVRHAMAGLLGHETSFARRRMTLGYREATLAADGPAGSAGAVLRGHEFHYATVTDPGPDAPLAMLRDGTGRDLGPAGGRRGRVSGGFFHAIAAQDRPVHQGSAGSPA